MIVKTPASVDPYWTWLGVRATQRPLTPYQILNLEPGEKDTEKIEGAAQAQRRLLARHRPQADEMLWCRVSRELESAIAMLLDAKKKASLDQTLGLSRNHRSAGGTAAMIECAACEQANASDRRFCSSCGSSLWQACLQCSAECGVHESFCGQCGANLRELIRARSSEIESALHRAQQFKDAWEHDQALRALASLPESNPTIPARYTQRLKQLTEDIRQEQQRLNRESEQAVADSEKLLAERKFKEVLQRMQELPAPYLNQRGRQLIQSAATSYEEVKRLRSEIAADVEARRLIPLGPKIERYLALQPHEEKIRELARKVGDYVCKKVTEALAECDYKKAQLLLEHVPLSAHNDELQKLVDQVGEFSRLFFEIRHAAVVDASLVAVAERLRKMAPQAETVTKAIETLQQRMRQVPPDARFPLVAWAPAPKRTTVGVPVDVLGGFRRVQVTDPEIVTSLRKMPGLFFVASGLALQGLGVAHLTTNLLIEKSSRLLSKMSLFKNKRVVGNSAWGLDLGGSSLKAVKLVRDAKTGDIVLARCDVIPYSLNLAHPQAESRRTEIVGAALATFKQRHRASEDDVLCANCPSSQTLVRAFNVPTAKENKLAELIQFEAAHQIPFPLAEMAWGHSLIESAVHDREISGANGEPVKRAVVAAIRAQHAHVRQMDFENAGLRLHVLQADCIALHNLLAYDEFDFGSGKPAGGSADPHRTLGLLDIGSDSCNLLFSSSNDVWFRIFRLGGNDVNQAVARDLKLTFSQAEDVKHNPAKVDRLSLLFNSVEPILARLGSEVQRTFESFGKEFPDRQVERLWLCGGASLQTGVVRHLRSGSP